MAIIAAHSYRRSIDLNKWPGGRTTCSNSFHENRRTDVASDRPPTRSLSLSRGTWPILGRIDYHPNREIFTDASIDSFFSFLPSPIVSFKRSRVVSKWLMGCPSSEVFHRFVSRENDENSKEMERESRVRFARDISRYLWIVLIIVLITKNSSKYACQRSNFF